MSLLVQIPEIALHIVPFLRNLSFENISGELYLFLVPAKVVVGWPDVRANIPAGFIECAGQTLTDGFVVPDYRGRFMRHPAAGVEPGGTGGSDTVILTEANLAAHDHPIGGSTGAEAAHTHAQVAHTHTVGAPGNHTHNIAASVVNLTAGTSPITVIGGAGSATTTGQSATHTHTVTGGATTTGAGSSHTHTLPANTSNAGSGTAHQNMPAYIDVLWIMKLPRGVTVA